MDRLALVLESGTGRLYRRGANAEVNSNLPARSEADSSLLVGQDHIGVPYNSLPIAFGAGEILVTLRVFREEMNTADNVVIQEDNNPGLRK